MSIELEFRDGLAVLLDSLAEGILVVSEDAVLFANGRLYEILGLQAGARKPADVDLRRWVHPEDADGLHTILSPDGRDSDGGFHEIRVIDGDNRLRWLSCGPRATHWGGRKAVVCSITDVTETVQEREGRARSEALFRNVFRLMPDAMSLSSLKDGRFLDVNPSFLNVLGRRRDDVIGKTAEEICMWADPMFNSRFSEELKMTASMTDVPATVLARGNVIRHFRLFAQKIETAPEPVLLLIGRDVTEDIVQAQELARSRDTAEIANRAKSEFLANMSHELRTPLNAILGFSEILAEQMLGPIGMARYAEYARDIHNSGTHLLSIINDILDLSKVEAGRLEASLTWIDPVESFDLVTHLMEQRAENGGVTLVRDIDKSLYVEADERLFRQICLNLLSNAVKFTEPGGTVTLKFERTLGRGAALIVEDTGVGMTADEIRVAKRPFGQVDSGLARNHEGSGLGLPLVIAFADKMGATVGIDSVPRVGTSVSVVFPGDKVKPKKSKHEQQ
ncbi:PAS domain-containing sensor histidine kinase [Pseudokordiimonas caeni]|uniref:PAS domain-containing sensor histidine kinase n=1 Tax=Pseudokordiimonas caeni TaxID=2997908 RepID=UPI0028116DED|nr:histidine kinase dimerization/phospho-acceptor domain-containing protein [Pseudokordiimonas caeni]